MKRSDRSKARRLLSELGSRLEFAESVPEWLRQVVLDPQTSGGLALFGQGVQMGVRIGRVVAGQAGLAIQ